MTLTVYLCGVFISAALWFILVKVRQGGFYIPMPRKFDGNLLDPLNHNDVDYQSVMLGWFLISVLWPLGWSLLILFYIIAWIIEIVAISWSATVGNEKLANRIFKGKK